MSRTQLTVFWMLVASGAAPASEPAAEVRAVFSAKCAGCHGPALAKPKGRFGYVLDLARVAGNREMVVPGAPDESELWELVRRGEMPPDDSPAGPLTAGQKETIRAWIAAGAPADAADAPPAATAADTSPAGAPALTPTLRRLGRLHVVLVHFPIALLIAAAAGEVWSAWYRRSTPAPAVHFCVLLGASGAVTTAEDAYAKIRNGASLVQLFTAMVYEGPLLARRIVRGLAQLLERDGFKSVTEAVGVDIR